MEQPHLFGASLHISGGMDGRKGQACHADSAPIRSVGSWPNQSSVQTSPRAPLAVPMKKIPKSFAIEVKRSRLPARQQSTFQRYVLPALAEAEPEPMLLQAPTTIPNPDPPPSQRRVLPDLSGGKVWVDEPSPPQPAMTEPVAVCGASEEQAVEALLAPLAEVISSAAGLAAPDPEDLHPAPKRRKRLRGTAADLPRGQRWKRRLPRAAW
jgi:hypothetical protein